MTFHQSDRDSLTFLLELVGVFDDEASADVIQC